MPTNAPRRVSDGFITLEQGVDSGKAPNLVQPNQVAWAVNTTFRGGWPYNRPGFRKIALNFDADEDLQAAFQEALLQSAGAYVTDQGEGSLISMHSGRVFRTMLSNNGTFSVMEISIAGDPNPSNIPQAWGIQAENYFIIQDGQSKPFIYNGGSSVRANEKQIPVGQMMAYYMGRIWIAQGRAYVAGDIVYNPDRGSILGFTENTFLAEGGAFGVPVSSGAITAIKPIASINTVLGQGELIVYTQNSVFSTLVPQDRTQWKNTTNPVQRMIQLSSGAFSQDSVTSVNEDHYYRSNDGIRSLAYSVRNAGQLGNTTISKEMSRILDKDPQQFLYAASATYFDKRMLMTTSPATVQGRGTYHRALVSLDFDLITSMQGKAPPAWEGVWTGLNILKILNVTHQGVERCFLYVLNAEAKIELWELTTDSPTDFTGTEEQRIQWSIESRAMDFGSKFDMKNLFAGDLFFDNVRNQVDFNLDFRPDSLGGGNDGCWRDWDSWDACSKTTFCIEDLLGTCPTLPNAKPGYAPKRQLIQPPDDFNNQLNPPIKYRTGYEFQVRLQMTGACRVKQCRINSQIVEERPFGNQL